MAERRQLRPDKQWSFPQQHRVFNVASPKGSRSLYDEGDLENAYKLCLLGATNKDLARYFEVTEQCIDNWLRGDKPGFRDAVQAGRDYADANVAKALYRRATGYSYPATKIFYDREHGQVVTVNYTEFLPPDVAAARHWLMVRQKDRWATPSLDSTQVAIASEAPVFVIKPVEVREHPTAHQTIDGKVEEAEIVE